MLFYISTWENVPAITLSKNTEKILLRPKFF